MVDFYEEWAAETLSIYNATGEECYSEAASELLRCANDVIRNGGD